MNFQAYIIQTADFRSRPQMKLLPSVNLVTLNPTSHMKSVIFLYQ